MLSSYGQNISDAVRYSTETTLGTARFKSMSGAFGALGGDMSAVSVNPAGSAIFNKIIKLNRSNPEIYGNKNSAKPGTGKKQIKKFRTII